MNWFPLAAFDLIPNHEADALLEAWGHWLGGCDRPFGRQSFGLHVEPYGVVSVAVSASTVNETCGGYPRMEVVELARQASHPDHRWATRVTVRLWRELAPGCWAAKYWPVRAVVSYSNNNRHLGNIYRFDGWRRVAEVRGSTGGGTWTRKKAMEPKTVWAYDLPAVSPSASATHGAVSRAARSSSDLPASPSPSRDATRSSACRGPEPASALPRRAVGSLPSRRPSLTTMLYLFNMLTQGEILP